MEKIPINMFKYVLLTATKNEEMYIEKTIKSVISQTILPDRWVIVSDGSTDNTDKIVQYYAREQTFIKFVRLEADNERNFASKVFALKEGVKYIKNIRYNFIGVLDSDISFESSYYENVFKKFQQNPGLGIASGRIIDIRKGREYLNYQNLNSVAGAVHLFRRECYEDIGGFVPMKEGGYDAVAEITARMKGWETKTFTDITAYHLKPNNYWVGNNMKLMLQLGRRDYFLGYAPEFEFIKSIHRIFIKPYFFSIFRIIGYFCLLLKRAKPSVSEDVVKYIRAAQRKRIYNFLSRKLTQNVKE